MLKIELLSTGPKALYNLIITYTNNVVASESDTLAGNSHLLLAQQMYISDKKTSLSTTQS